MHLRTGSPRCATCPIAEEAPQGRRVALPAGRRGRPRAGGGARRQQQRQHHQQRRGGDSRPMDHQRIDAVRLGPAGWLTLTLILTRTRTTRTPTLTLTLTLTLTMTRASTFPTGAAARPARRLHAAWVRHGGCDSTLQHRYRPERGRAPGAGPLTLTLTLPLPLPSPSPSPAPAPAPSPHAHAHAHRNPDQVENLADNPMAGERLADLLPLHRLSITLTLTLPYP